MKRWLATPAAKSAIFFTAASTSASRASGSVVIRAGIEGRRLRHFVHQLLDGAEQRKLPAQRALHQPAGDDQPVDFIGAFEDLG
jgi:hypothetical protein